MKRYEFYKKIVVIGDKSKYLFIKDYLIDDSKFDYSIEELEKNNIYILYDNKNYIEKDNDCIKICSKKFPKTKLTIIPKDILEVRLESKDIDKLVVFNSFPYAKLDLLEDVDFVLKEFNVNDVDSILYKENRRFGATDISTEKESIKRAIKIYKEKNINTKIYNHNKNNEDIFNIAPDFIASFKDDYKNKFYKSIEKFNSRYEREYDLKVKQYFNMFTLLDPDEFERFNNMFSFNNIKKSDDIWNTFVENFKKNYIVDSMGILPEVKDLYKSYVSEICFWDMENDLENLENLIIKEYKNHFGREKKLKAPINELEYIKLMNNSKENSLEVLFKKKLTDFVDIKLKDTIKIYINNYYDKIKDMIGD